MVILGRKSFILSSEASDTDYKIFASESIGQQGIPVYCGKRIWKIVKCGTLTPIWHICDTDSIQFSQFVLDHLPLSNSEKMLVAENRVFAISTNQSSSIASSISVYDMHEFDEERLDHRTISLPGNLEKSVTRSKRRPNVKEAVIDEIDQEREEFKKLPDVVASSHLGKYFSTDKMYVVEYNVS